MDAGWKKRTGNRAGKYKITDEQVRTIRKMGQDGLSAPEISDLFGVGPETIRRIVNRLSHRDVLDAPALGGKVVAVAPHGQMDDIMRQVRMAHEHTMKQMAAGDYAEGLVKQAEAQRKAFEKGSVRDPLEGEDIPDDAGDAGLQHLVQQAAAVVLPAERMLEELAGESEKPKSTGKSLADAWLEKGFQRREREDAGGKPE